MGLVMRLHNMELNTSAPYRSFGATAPFRMCLLRMNGPILATSARPSLARPFQQIRGPQRSMEAHSQLFVHASDRDLLTTKGPPCPSLIVPFRDLPTTKALPLP